jgi:ABC-type transport system involved in multi-copper enzyme maturation permease subunit
MLSGITAIAVKDLRGRMRGRRTFVIVTIYLVLLAAFGWMLERMNEEQLALGFCGARDIRGCGVGWGGQAAIYASSAVGRGIFVGLMQLLSLMVIVLAPASTATAISGERERQTLDLLAVTPISSLAIVLGKLLSALAWVFVLILASIPITSLVFVFGGVAPDDILRGYAVLLATALGMGAIGLFFSTVVRRTGASTSLTYVTTIALTVGSIFVWEFLHTTAPRNPNTGVQAPPSEAILYFNPFIAQADVACGTEGGLGTWCRVRNSVLDGSDSLLSPLFNGGGGQNFGIDDQTVILKFGGGGGGAAPCPANGRCDFPAAGGEVTATAIGGASTLHRLWSRTVGAFLVLGLILTFVSVQLVTMSRRWSLPRSLAARFPRTSSREA